MPRSKSGKENSLLSVTLAHLSDPHLPLEALPSFRELLGKRALSLLSWHANRRYIHQRAPLEMVVRDIEACHPDAVAVTGDLTNLGTNRECRAARKWLGRFSAPRAVIPGNHDALVRTRWESGPGVWKSEGGMAAADAPVMLTVGDVALIGVSSAVPTLPFFAAGWVGERQLVQLGTMLRDAGQRGLCRVVMIHHPPRLGMVSWRKGLWDIDRFGEVVRAAGAEMILHGHSHDGTVTRLADSSIPVIGVSSASHRPCRHMNRAAGWNRITIDRNVARTGWTLSVEERRLSRDYCMRTLRTHEFVRPMQGSEAIGAYAS
ncbi:MAG: metallophosphoesterase [Acetobacter sp.]